MVFIDDLDRCTPERALEVLESIKSFFDIEGIVYVIGMDSNSIDSIIKQKYGDSLNVTGLDYMQKIVQLPFQIPFWNESDIERYLNYITNKKLRSTLFQSDILDNLQILTKAIRWNPREAKRFINNVLLARAVFDKPVDELIVVQALNFRNDWKKFLELITPNDKRKEFLDQYKMQKEQDKTLVIKDLALLNKEVSERYPSFKRILEAYPSFSNQHNSLRSFLDSGADKILLEIKDMEGHRRALKAISTEGITTGSIMVDSVGSGGIKQIAQTVQGWIKRNKDRAVTIEMADGEKIEIKDISDEDQQKIIDTWVMHQMQKMSVKNG